MKRIDDLLNKKENHQLYPFFWQHGESLENINEYIDKMLEQGIHNMCIESRPHPEFLEDGWWNTIDFIIQKAKQNHMKVWILDDAKFPTGYANGKVPLELKKKYLNYHRFDIVGTGKMLEINLKYLPGIREMMKDKRHNNDKILCAILVQNDISSKDAFVENTQQDITDSIKEDILKIQLSKDNYSIFVLYETYCGQEDATKDYLDPMNSKATQVLIQEVYEKHYQHYKNEFGKTIEGFFSDEPRFGNAKGPNHIIGHSDMPLPWNNIVYSKLIHLKEFDIKDFIYLFKGESKKAKEFRFEYMNIVTQLYSENFSQYIGKWCENHAVEYYGHVIEDNNAHARLGYGPGHYFRAIAGQHVAGIDIIGGQVVPGMDYYHDAFSTGGSDGEFYHYSLVNLGASAAKLDPKKKGRCMCEAFGAYGWVEGLKMMKWITDHMISHGVNIIVPHAFDPKEFPDWDCPPHFYAHGFNPQYEYFKKWSSYANRLCYLMSDGYKYGKVGILYHAFGEWHDNCMHIQKVQKELQQHQISFDIISEDYLMESKIEDNCYLINNYKYEVLIIPFVKQLPQKLLDKISELNKHCLVLFIECEMIENSKNISLNQLVKYLDKYKDIVLLTNEEKLVCYKYSQNDGNIYMLSNEDINRTIKTQIKLFEDTEYEVYDAYQNKVYHLSKDKNGYFITLHPYESIVLVPGNVGQSRSKRGDLICSIDQVELSMKAFNENIFSKKQRRVLPFDLTNEYSNFSGQIKYEFDIELKDTNVLLSLDNAYEIVEVIINDKKDDNVRICPPYNFDLSSDVKKGNNHIEIIVTNNLCRNQRDAMSMYLPLESMGIEGKISLYKIIEEH